MAKVSSKHNRQTEVKLTLSLLPTGLEAALRRLDQNLGPVVLHYYQLIFPVYPTRLGYSLLKCSVNVLSLS